MVSRRPVNVTQPREPNRAKVILLGDVSVGKTALAERYVNDVFNARQDATIGMDFYSKDLSLNRKLVLWDASGRPEYVEVRNEFYKDVQAIILIFDISNKRSFETLDMWFREAGKYTTSPPLLIVAGNKADLAGRRAVTKAEAESWASSRRYDYFEVSASSGQSVNQLFDAVVSRVM
mmetsp:Transcript_3181/g.6575  ORF Transcript_3181/g.6575 Transcript_3181/m.6575 type:complete len:177 (+) Transcript_3181:6-536(+)